MRIIIALFLILWGLPGLAGQVLVIKRDNTVIDGTHKVFQTGDTVDIKIRGPVKNVVIRDVKFTGSIRTIGLGHNGESQGVLESSTSTGHTERAQAKAPKNTIIENVEIKAESRIPIYLAPGTTGTIVRNSKITGYAGGPAIYLDAESAENQILDNVFDIQIGKGREVLAIDGSAENEIRGNRFLNIKNGGIYIYRNCGEGGTIRHQVPQFNIISDNYFDIRKMNEWRKPVPFMFWWERTAGIWIGSRQGIRAYCLSDSGKDFGSSKNNKDFANNNTVVRNHFQGEGQMIRDRGNDNTIKQNERVR